MKRISALFLVALLFMVPAYSQKMADDGEILKVIASSSASIKSMCCDFTQVKESDMLVSPAVSSGVMDYRSEGKVMWRYDKPEHFQLSITPEKVVITSAGQTKVLTSGDSSPVFQLKSLIVGLMNGSRIVSGDTFDCEVEEAGNDIVVKLTPRVRQMKKLFNCFRITFSAKDYSVCKFVMEEVKGGKTTITFTNKIITR